MTYELWDTTTNNLVGAYDTEREALGVVADAVRLHGPAYTDTLSLIRDEAEGDVEAVAAGSDLTRRAELTLLAR